MKVLLENLLRNEDGRSVTKDDIQGVAEWLVNKRQDGAGNLLPPGARADAGLHRRSRGGRSGRHARRHDPARSGDPQKINPLVPVDLVIDHSVIVDEFGSATRR